MTAKFVMLFRLLRRVSKSLLTAGAGLLFFGFFPIYYLLGYSVTTPPSPSLRHFSGAVIVVVVVVVLGRKKLVICCFLATSFTLFPLVFFGTNFLFWGLVSLCFEGNVPTGFPSFPCLAAADAGAIATELLSFLITGGRGRLSVDVELLLLPLLLLLLLLPFFFSSLLLSPGRLVNHLRKEPRCIAFDAKFCNATIKSSLDIRLPFLRSK
mmetsp:Transcript_15472/g.21655  ORF Transcript_15472/g.21655 Transcript_15472/m.21655 type:complete len:210 (-) Transcript_15472:631-1260(-)